MSLVFESITWEFSHEANCDRRMCWIFDIFNMYGPVGRSSHGYKTYQL